MPNETRLQTKDLVLTIAEYQQRTPQEGSPRTVTPSTMTVNTVVSAQLNSTHVGCYLIPEDGNIRGNPAQIKSFTLATTTATMDRSWASSTGVTTLRIWTPSDVPVEAASGSTTSVVSTAHQNIANEPDGTFVGAFLLAKTGANAGGAYKINTFTSSTGTFDLTGDPLGTACAPGDLFLIRRMLRPEASATVTVSRGTIERRIVGYGDADQAVVTLSPGTADITLAQRPLPSSAGNATAAVPPYEMGDIFRDVMTEKLDTGSTYASQTGSVPTGITIMVASGAGFSVGGFALMSTGEASQITNIATNALTMPQLTAAANLASSTVYASAWYQRKTSNFFTRTIERYAGKLLRQSLHGCAPTIELDITRDQVVKFMLKYTSPDGVEYNIADPNALAGHRFALADLTVPVDGKGARIMIDSIPVLVADAKITFGFKPMLRSSLSGMNQADGYALDLEPVKIAMTGYLADNDDIASMPDIQDRLVLGNVLSLFYQKGSNPKETFCWSAPAAQLTKSEFKYANGIGAFDFEATCVLPQAARGNTANVLLPAFAVGYC